jgi:hypothetical protein
MTGVRRRRHPPTKAAEAAVDHHARGSMRQPSRLFPCRRTISPISRESAHASNPPASRCRLMSCGHPMDSGGGSATATTAVIYCVKKLDSNLLGVSHTFGNIDYKFAIPAGGGLHA